MLNFDVLDYLSKLAIKAGIWDINDYFNFTKVFPGHPTPIELIPIALEHYSSTGDSVKFSKFQGKIDLSRDRRELIETAIDKSQWKLLNQYYKYWDLNFGNYSPFLTAIKFGHLNILETLPTCTSDMVLHAIIYNQLDILQYFRRRFNPPFNELNLLIACQNSNSQVISFLLGVGIIPNTECILITLKDAKITRELLHSARLSRLGFSCLIASSKENGYQESTRVLEEFRSINFP